MRRTTLAVTALFAVVVVAGAAGLAASAPPSGVAPGSGNGGSASGVGPADAGTGATSDGLLGVGGVLGLLSTWGVTGVQLLMWVSLAVFGAIALFWFLETYVLAGGYEPPANAYGPEDVQVRILTVDAEDVVQETVDSLPDSLTDRHVVAETEIDVDGATVHVVPDEFDCEAVRKGRAIEWARRTLACEREYVLYLDEDSVVESFDGLPDGDVVQLRERPRRTGSWLTYLADVYRMGVQFEQRAFARLSIPLFAWGGGIAVRESLEDEVTWNRASLVEDTAFVWAAARNRDLDYELADAVCRNQAPPSLREIVQQRRRWAAGNHAEASMLPAHYRLLTRLRNYAWALSPVVTVAALSLLVTGAVFVTDPLFRVASVALVGVTAFWFVRGALWYGDDSPTRPLGLVATLPLLPLVSVVHSAGTLWGLVDPPERFRVTEKTTSV